MNTCSEYAHVVVNASLDFLSKKLSKQQKSEKSGQKSTKK